METFPFRILALSEVPDALLRKKPERLLPHLTDPTVDFVDLCVDLCTAQQRFGHWVAVVVSTGQQAAALL